MSPYGVYFDWLYDGADSELPEIVIENKNKFSVHYLLNLFMRSKKACLYVNKYLNNFYCIGMPFEEFSKTIKFMIQQFGLSKFDLFHSKFIYNNRNKEISEISNKYPLLKSYEILLLHEEYKKYYDENTGVSKKISNRKSKTKIDKIKFEDLIAKFKDVKSKCSECALISEPLCLFDTNSKSNVCGVDIMFVGEAPGKNEAEAGVPFVGRSGELLRKYIKEYIVKNKLKYLIGNSVFCRPPDNKINPEYVLSCEKNLDELINTVKPKMLITVGAISMKRFGITGKITDNHGSIFKYDRMNIPCFVLVHPAAILRGVYNEELYKKDFEKLVSIVKK